MSEWLGYSPEFQDAYNRRFEPRVKGEKVFNEWVTEFKMWINQGNIEDKNIRRQEITKAQIKALAYNAKKEGLQNISIQTTVRDKRTSLGYRNVFRDVNSGRFAKNPYKENE